MNKYIEERFTTPNKYKTDGEAMKARNARARELRHQGWTVDCHMWDFTDLGRGRSYTLEAFQKGE